MNLLLRVCLSSVALKFLFFVGLESRLALAWEDHALITYQAFSVVESVQQAEGIRVESLESFLKKEKQGLAELLREEETWAQNHVKSYPARPSEIEFSSRCKDEHLKDCFLRALRVNPHLKLKLFIQLIPGETLKGALSIPAQSVTLLSHSFKSTDERFVEVKEGQIVQPLKVLASASDEPDYGLDLGLWEDNATEFGQHYRMGNQPFGNPVLEFSGQAPFHMSFFHEPRLAYAIAGYLNRTYPEYRIHLFSTLSRYAFQSHHPYWGFRFAGWALHYIQDLTQPYHSTAMPGVSFFRTFILGLLDMIGIHSPLKNRIQLLTNEHLALENFQYHSFYEAYQQGHSTQPFMQALLEKVRDQSYPTYTDAYPRELITKEAYQVSARTHEEMRQQFPNHLIQDPKYLFGTTEPGVNLPELLKRQGLEQQHQRMKTLLADLMKNTGSHSRKFILEGILR